MDWDTESEGQPLQCLANCRCWQCQEEDDRSVELWEQRQAEKHGYSWGWKQP